MRSQRRRLRSIWSEELVLLLRHGLQLLLSAHAFCKGPRHPTGGEVMVESNRTVQQQPEAGKGKELLTELQRRLAALPEPAKNVKPEDAMRAVMCNFSRHVSGGEARQVFDALPNDVHPLLERCMLHRGEQARRFGRDDLLTMVAEHLGIPVDAAEQVTTAVLQTISAQLHAKEVHDVADQLPKDLQDLWVVSEDRLPAVEPHPIVEMIEKDAALPRGVTGAKAFANVMCLLTKRLSLGEARHLVSSIPEKVRPLLANCLNARGEKGERFDRDRLLYLVGHELGTDHAEPVVSAVFRAAQKFMDKEVIEHVKSQLPADLQTLWVRP
jgi:uncharacterized protein (DUF2267 family)